jgi:hypothetical protein
VMPGLGKVLKVRLEIRAIHRSNLESRTFRLNKVTLCDSDMRTMTRTNFCCSVTYLIDQE